MTRIHLSPLEQTSDEIRPAAATLTARPSYPYYVDGDAVVLPSTSRWTFRTGQSVPVVELTEPVGYAWVLTLSYGGGWTWERAVMWVGDDLDWADLTDVDPATLAQLPDGVSTPTGKTLLTREDAAAAYATKDELAEVRHGVQYVRDVAAAEWSIPHGFGRRPVVTLYDPTGRQMLADVAATSSLVLVTFANPTAGSAVLT